MIIHEQLIQGSEAWLNQRRGVATSSQAKRIVTPTGKLSSQRHDYMRELARERWMDDPIQFIGNKYTDWGHEHEPAARQAFAEMTGLNVDEVGFVQPYENAPVGCSPDGLVKNDKGDYIAGLEIKCPQIDSFLQILLEQKMPDDHKPQVHWSMSVTGMKQWYFVAYHPNFLPYIEPIAADAFTTSVNAARDKFLLEYAREITNVNEIIKQYKSA